MTQTIYPILRCRDPRAAMDWLERTLGFERDAVHEGDDGSVAHAELSFRGATIMLGSAEGVDREAGEIGASLTYIAVDEVDSVYERARDAGAEITMEPTDQDYGSRDFAVRDPERNVWSFGTYRPAG
ncbi:MAG: VOC family protein [Thermoleophilaceae bacterium]